MDDQAQGAVGEVDVVARLTERYAKQSEEQKQENQEQTNEEKPVGDAPQEAETEAQGEEEQGQDDALLTPEQLAHYKVKVKNGEEEAEVSLEEARLGYMREQDYRKKTQELSRERNELPTKLKEQLAKESDKYQQNLRLFQQAMANLADQELVNTDWNKLANEDPAEFVKKMHRKTQFENFLKAAAQEIQKQDEVRKQETSEQQAQALAQAQERLKTSIPGWGEELAQKITKSAQSYGFSREELAGISDARYVEVLHDAMQFRELKDKKSLIEKKVAEAPKVLKPGTQQSKVSINAEREKELRTSFKKSGNTDDLARLLLNRQSRR